MKELFPRPRLLAAEMLGALADYPGEFFSPGEMLAVLRACPAWSEYLNGFETDRGQPAAVGRFLVELGLVKSGHHRTRGSLYQCAGTVRRLRHAVEGTLPEEAEEAETTEATLPGARTEMQAALPPGVPTPSLATRVEGFAAHAERPPEGDVPRRAEPVVVPAAVWTGPTAAAAAAPAMVPDVREGGASAPANVTPGGPPGVIGFRRRASDRGAGAGAGDRRSGGAETLPLGPPGPPGPTLSGFGTAPAMPPPVAAHAGAAVSGGAAPVWVGSGTAMGPGGYAPGVSPWGGMGGGGMAVPYTPMLGAAAGTEEATGLPLAFYWHQIRRHLYKIVLAAVMVTTLVGFYTLRIPKLYMATATLRMDFRAPAIRADAESNPAFDPTTLLQTEVNDVGQRAVMIEAIETAHLDQNPDLERELYGAKAPPATSADPDARYDPLVGLMQGRYAAAAPDNTHNIQISYKSLSAQTSATVANAIANALIDHEFKTRQDEQDKQLKYTETNFNDLNARTEKEQTDLAAYQRQNNILNPDSQNSQEASVFQSLNSSHLQAQDKLTQLQAEEDMLQASQKGQKLVEALLSTPDGQSLQLPYNAVQAAQKDFDAIQLTRGANNPEYKAKQQALTVAQEALLQAVNGVKEQVDAQYQRAQHQEVLVGKQLQTAKDAMQAFNSHMLDYTTKNQALQNDLKLRSDLEQQIKTQQVSSSQSSSALRVTDPATPDPVPVYPNVKKNVVLAMMFSLFFGAGLAILAGYMDRSFTSPESVEQYLHVPLLGALPMFSSKDSPIALAQQPGVEDAASAEGHSPRSAFVEAILMLRTSVMYAAPQGFRTLNVTSAQPQEGKSSVIANLAIACARHGAKVLLVDCDIRRPTQHRLFEVPNQVGLSSLLRQTAAMEDCFRPTTVERLYLMPAGPAVANPSELIATQLPPVLAALAAEFDYILVDSPPLIGFADAVSIATTVDATLMVTRAGKTQRELVLGALQPLKRVRARIIGLALNGITKSLSPYYSYYSQSSTYYESRNGEEETT